MDPLKPKRGTRTKKSKAGNPADAGTDVASETASGAAPGGASGGASDPAAGVNEFGQLALWMAASLAGLVTALLVARAPFFRAMLKRLGAGGAKSDWQRAEGDPLAVRRAVRSESLPRLADAIVGNSKSAVAAVFGPPRSAVLRGVVAPGAHKAAYWQANTWYYALPKPEALAMAIEFDDDSARRVEFFKAPGL